MKDPPPLFAWVVAGSIALHVALVFVLPNVRARARAMPSTIEVTELPPTPPLPTPTPPPSPSPAPAPAAPRTALAAHKEPTRVAQTSTPAAEAPVDFTGTVLSDDGPGVAITTGAVSPLSPSPSAKARTETTRAAAPAGPRFVAPGDLSRAPRAPSLDVALERNYPADARRAGVSGTAVLRVEILPDGRIGGVERVSESYRGFGDACERTVRSGRWEGPVDRTGAPVATRITYTCRFEVRS